MGFWYSSLQDRTQSWYWTGIAISTAQTIGLHRDPDSKRQNKALSSSQRRLWKNIWWCCVFRDRWLAFGSGRPLRINADDCNMPFPDEDCMLLPRNSLPFSTQKLIPTELAQLSGLFLGLLRLAVVLGDILTSQRGHQPLESKNVAPLAHRLESCVPDLLHDVDGTDLTHFYKMFTQLHVE